MRFAHSFWSVPLFNNIDKSSTCIQTTLLDAAYSVACIHKAGYEIYLYCDEEAAEFFSSIPYDKVIIIDVPSDASAHFAAQMKFEAMKRMNLGDCLIDQDLFLRKPSLAKAIESREDDLIYSFFEPNEFIIPVNNPYLRKNCTNYYEKLLPKMRNTQYLPGYRVPEVSELEWFNTSLTRFNNQELKDKYIHQYETHKSLLSNIDFEYVWPDLILEQYFLYLLISNDNYSQVPIIADYLAPDSNKIACEIGFTHLGSAKKSLDNWVSELLRNIDPSLYIKVVEDIQKYRAKYDKTTAISGSSH